MTRPDPAGDVDGVDAIERSIAARDSDGSPRGRTPKPRRPLLRSARFWVPIGILLLLVVLALWGLTAASKAFAAKEALEEAIPLASTLKSQVVAGEYDAADATLAELSASTSEADEIVNEPVWRVSEFVPVVGANFTAVREMVTAASLVVEDGAPPLLSAARTLSPDQIVLSGSGINPQPFADAAGQVSAANDAVSRARDIVESIDASGLIPQVSGAKAELQQRITEMADPLASIDAVVSLLPGVLGAEGPRTYVLLFQNPAEMRPLGGLPGRIAEVSVTNGSPSLVRQTDSSPASIGGDGTPKLEVSPEKRRLFGDGYGLNMSLATNTPHWDDAAIIAKALWERQFGTPVDGVLSIDTVALGYILKATGPITLSDGTQLDSGNLVDVLLNRVYIEVEDPAIQDEIYASLVDVTFAKIASGQFDVTAMLDAMTKGLGEARVLFWSAHEAEQAQLKTAGAYFGPPASDDRTAGVGIYLSDNQGSKLDYYLRQTVTIAHATCTPGEPERARISLALGNAVPAGEAADLPESIIGMSQREGVPWGHIRAFAYVYLPTGTGVTGATIDGAPAEYEVVQDGDNPVLKVRMQIAPDTTKTLVVDAQASEVGDRDWKVHVGPLVSPTKVAESDDAC